MFRTRSGWPGLGGQPTLHDGRNSLRHGVVAVGQQVVEFTLGQFAVGDGRNDCAVALTVTSARSGEHSHGKHGEDEMETA